MQDFAFGRVARSLRALPNAKSCTEKAHKEFRGSPKRKILRFCSIARVLLYFPRYFGTWRSLVARLLWEQDVAGSNPVVPTMNLGCEPCRAITFGRARLSLTKKLTENKEQLAELEVTKIGNVSFALRQLKPPAPGANPKLWDSRCRQTQQTLLRLGGPLLSKPREILCGWHVSICIRSRIGELLCKE